MTFRSKVNKRFAGGPIERDFEGRHARIDMPDRLEQLLQAHAVVHVDVVELAVVEQHTVAQRAR